MTAAALVSSDSGLWDLLRVAGAFTLIGAVALWRTYYPRKDSK